ncbi:SPOR domain-containing protein [Haloimpatiens sp. FM7330]|uniref:SPOR domain-containing protein n=1 Tax=Haloimpatiens sp. FM7330 TaxID=3298610 RepID=UPI00362C0563
MRYTRYELKRKRNNLIFLIIAVVIVIAVVLIVKGKHSNIDKKDNIRNNTKIEEQDNESSKNIKEKLAKFYVIQCGVFTSKENAENLKNSLSTYGSPFIVKKDNKFKVILGIYEDKQLATIMKTLNDNNIEKARVTYEIQKNDLCNMEIAEIIHANIEVLGKLTEKNVKSIKMDNLKKWTNSLKKVDKNSKNYNALLKLKEYVKKLPNEIKKENLNTSYVFLFNILNMFK